MIARSIAVGDNTKISIDEYIAWQKNFLFDALKGEHYGQSFAKQFDIKDFRIQFERDWQRCDKIIRRDWITNHASCNT